MVIHWKTDILGNIPIKFIDGDRSSRYPKREEFISEGIPFLNAESINENHVNLSKVNFIPEEKFLSITKGRLQEGDLILTTRGNGVGQAALFNQTSQDALINAQLLILRPDKAHIDPAFLYYSFITPFFKSNLKNFVSGSAQPQLPIKSLRNIKFSYPPLITQHKIAEILSKYDNLIDNNNRRIALLEESIHLLYKDWFVRLRFPGYESVKVVDGVPEGWKYEPLEMICELIMGQSPPSEFYNNLGQGLPFHQGVSNFGNRFVNHEIYCTQINRIAEPGDILCSVRAPVGRLNITLDKIIVGRGLSAIRNRLGYQSFQYYQLKTLFFQEDIIGNGSIFASVTKKQLSQQLIIVPSAEIINKFEKISKPVDKQIINLYFQNQKLKEARDLLLPRLMSGKIIV